MAGYLLRKKDSLLEPIERTRGLTIAGLNIRSLAPKVSQIECLLEGESIDVLCLSESWLAKKIPNNFLRIDNYKIYRWDREEKKRGGGICAYVHRKLLVNSEIYSELNISDQHIELAIVQISQKCTKPFTIIMVYRPPQGNQSLCLQRLREALIAVADGNKTIIVGDLNIDYKQTNTKSVKQLLRIEREFNLSQHIKTCTRATATTDSLIDHIYTNIAEVIVAGTIKITLSDHYMTYIIIKKQQVKLGTTTFTCRVLKNLVLEDLEEQLQSVDCSDFYSCNDPMLCWEIMYSHYLEVLDKQCPEKTFKEVKKRNDWVTSQLFELMQRRDHLFKEAKNKKDKDMWIEARQFRNTVNDTCKYAKGDYIKQTLNNERGNPHKFWEKLKPLYDTKSTEKNPTISLEGCSSNEQVANTFNSFFLSVGDKLKNKINPLSDTDRQTLNSMESKLPCKDNESQAVPRFQFRKTNTLELEQLVKKIQVHKASGKKESAAIC